MRVDIVRGRNYVSFLKAFLCFVAVCMLFAAVAPEDVEDFDSPKGWGMDGLFIGVSVSMIQCLVVLLFFTLWMVTFTHFVAHVSKFKSAAALAERYTQRGQKHDEADYTVDGHSQLAEVADSITSGGKQRKQTHGALSVMKVMQAVLHNRALTKRSLAP